MRDVILHGMARARKEEEALAEGIKAYVWLYFNDFTDATELEPDVVRKLEWLVNILEVTDLDLPELVTEAEQEINEAGGIRSDSDGTVHTVQTFVGMEEQ